MATSSARLRARAPDLKVVAVSAPAAMSGGAARVRVLFTIANRGTGPARASTSGFWFSRDRRSSSDDVRLSATVRLRPLRRGVRVKASATFERN